MYIKKDSLKNKCVVIKSYTNADANLVGVFLCGGNKSTSNELYVPKSKIKIVRQKRGIKIK